MSVKEISNRIDLGLSGFSHKYGMIFLESSIGFIYLWFGVLKFFPGYSPAEDLAADTLRLMTFELVGKDILLWILATWELLIGICLILRIKSKYVIWILLVHMGGTLSPMFFFPELIFHHPPFGFSIVGQYIMKNFIIIAAALVIYSKNTKEV